MFTLLAHTFLAPSPNHTQLASLLFDVLAAGVELTLIAALGRGLQVLQRLKAKMHSDLNTKHLEFIREVAHDVVVAVEQRAFADPALSTPARKKEFAIASIEHYLERFDLPPRVIAMADDIVEALVLELFNRGKLTTIGDDANTS